MKNFYNNGRSHGHLQEQVANKLDEWFKAGLQQWDISRDAPYFGFEIPGEQINIFMYGWMHRLAIWPVLKIYVQRNQI